MKGSVIKRTDAKGKVGYYVVVEERTTDGKRRRRWRTDPDTGSAFTSKRAAEGYAARLVTELGDGTYVEPNKETLGAWLDVWLELIRPTVRPSTWASYEKNVRLHIKPRLGGVKLARLNAADLDRLYQDLLAGGRATPARKDGKPRADADKGTGLSPRTVRYVSTILGRALKDAVRKGLIPRSPALAADPPKASASTSDTMRTWTAEELGRFLAAVEDADLGPVFTFLALTGTRRGEALGLRWSDLDLDGATASIVQTVGKVAGRVLIGTTKTNAGKRVVALDKGLVTALRAQRKRQNEHRLLMGAGWQDHDLVFADVDGNPLHPERVSRVFRETVDDLGLPPIRLHDLRHTWATLALRAKVHPKVVQERLGHANVAITLGIYSHVAPTLHEEAAETVAALLAPRAVDDR